MPGNENVTDGIRLRRELHHQRLGGVNGHENNEPAADDPVEIIVFEDLTSSDTDLLPDRSIDAVPRALAQHDFSTSLWVL